jgi:hypothetical protein
MQRRFAPAHGAGSSAAGGHDDAEARQVRQRLAAREIELEAVRATVQVKIERAAHLRVDVERRAGEAEVLRQQLANLSESMECALCMGMAHCARAPSLSLSRSHALTRARARALSLYMYIFILCLYSHGSVTECTSYMYREARRHGFHLRTLLLL